MNSRLLSKRNQQGAALLVSLIILVLVSLMGISALRSSVFSGKVATGVQADAMTFEAAETALGVTFRSLDSMTNQELYTGLADGVVEYCVRRDNPVATGACTSSDFLDDRQLLRAQSTSFLGGYAMRDGFAVGQTGSGNIFVDYQINMLAESAMPTLNLENYHLQEALKFGILPASDIE